MRVTTTRIAVFEELLGAGHLDADAIALRVAERLGGVSRQTVYDALRVLCEIGLVRRIEPAGSPAALYETRVADNHHHVVCRACGTVADIDCVTGSAPCLDAVRHPRLRRRRGRGHLLGPVPRVPVPSTRRRRGRLSDAPRQASHHPAGPAGPQQPAAAHGRHARPGDARELPVPREDQPLRPRARPRARRARARLRRPRRVQGVRQDRRRAGLDVHPRQAVPGGGQADAGHRSASRRSSAAATRPRSPATRAASRSSSAPRTATGTWSATTCRSSSSATRSSSRT